MIHTDSVHGTPSGDRSGWRILATRFRGRFLPKTAYDIWMPNLAPSERLLRRFQAGSITWQEFQRTYTHEMLGRTPPSESGNRVIKNHGQKFTLRLLGLLATREEVTLLCHCARDELHCHRHVLAGLIGRALTAGKRPPSSPRASSSSSKSPTRSRRA